MFRYLALVWDERSAIQTRCALALSSALQSQPRKWRAVLDGAGLRVYCSGTSQSVLRANVLPDKSGVVLGRTFPRDARMSSDAHEGAATLARRAQALIDSCWGRYVALWCDPLARKTLLVRDPSGGLRCFHTAKEGVHVICSHVEDCVALGLRFTINWNYVVAELANRAAMGWEQTGLVEVSAVRAGECLEISDASVRRYACWDPVRFAADPIEDASDAAREVRRTVGSCVTLWGSCHAHVGLLLSGGLDSSVILGCLLDTAAPPVVTCLNYFYDGPRADERSYARLAAQRADCRLVELQRSTAVRVESLLSFPPSARPSDNRLDHALHAERSIRWAKETGVSAVFTGDMGDQLFGQQIVGYAPMDCAWMHGVGRALFAASKHVAQMKEMAVWSALFGAAAYAWFGRRGGLRRFMIRRLSRDVNPYLKRRSLRSFDYRLRDRWIESIESLPIGKLYHIASIMSGQAYLTPLGDDDDPEWIAPLNSQPIIELCLRLPLYVLCKGGWNRAVFRQAFAADVPGEIVRRRTKGTTSTQRLAVYQSNATFLRKLLLEGVLAGSGLLDSDSLARDIDAQDYSRNLWLERCIRAETWLRIWDAQGTHMSCSDRYVYSSAS